MELDIAKQRYFREHLEKGIRDILEAQREIAAEGVYRSGSSRQVSGRYGQQVTGRSGALMDALVNPRYRVVPDGSGFRTETTLPTYIRFLDMKKHGNLKIYNRQIWGILYSETLKNIKFEFRDWLRKHFPELLEQFNSKTR